MNLRPLANHVFLDCETIPEQRPDAIDRARSRIKVPGNFSKPESIAKYLSEKAEEAWLKTSLDGTYGEVVCATFVVEDQPEPVTVVRRLDDPEADFLVELWRRLTDALDDAYVREPIWVGHRVGSFDLRFLYHRSVVHGVRPPYDIRPDLKPWHPSVRDTSYMWTGEANSGIALDLLAEALGIPSPKELFDGSQVWKLVSGGRYDELVAYNQGDTLTTREVYRRLTFLATD